MAKTTIRKLQAGVPPGGTAGQALVKNSGTNFDYDWASFSAGGGGGTKLFIETTPVSFTASVAETTLFTTPVTGGVLGTNDAVRFRIYLSELDTNAADTLTLRFKYGATTVATTVVNMTVTGTNAKGYIDGLLIANGATNAQVASLTINVDKDVSTNPVVGATTELTRIHVSEEGTAAVDSTVVQNLVVTAQFSSNSAQNLMTADYAVVERISALGAGSKKVGVGEIADIEWFNIQLPFSMVNTTDIQGNVWTGDTIGVAPVSPSFIELAAADKVLIDSDQNSLLPDFNVANGYHFDSNNQAIFSCIIRAATSGANNRGGVGFTAIGGFAFVNSQGSNTLGVGFVRDGAGQWYSRCADGAAFTENAVAITDGVPSVLRCEYDPGNATPQARFYVDGILVDTITTNVPSAINTIVGWAAGQSAALQIATEVVSCPSFAVEI